MADNNGHFITQGASLTRPPGFTRKDYPHYTLTCALSKNEYNKVYRLKIDRDLGFIEHLL